MNKILIVLLLAVAVFTACQQPKEEYKIIGNLSGVEDGEAYLLREKIEGGYDTLNVAEFIDGQFIMTGSVKNLEVVALRFSGKRLGFPPFVLDNDRYYLDAEFTELYQWSFKGGEWHQKLTNPFEQDLRYQRLRTLYYGNQAELVMAKYYGKKPEEEWIEYERKAFRYQQASGQQRNNCLQRETKNLEDPLHKLLFYNVFGIRYMPEDMQAEMDTIAQKLGYDHYYVQLLQNKVTKEIEQVEAKQSTEVGADYKNVTTVFRDGKKVELAEHLRNNKYIMLEFWASWCGPCKAEIPVMKKAYEKFNSTGFEIFSVSIDKTQKAWLNAADEKELPWVNTWDGGANGGAKNTYGVTGIPANFIIDSAGKIVAKNVRGDNLEKTLTELLVKE